MTAPSRRETPWRALVYSNWEKLQGGTICWKRLRRRSNRFQQGWTNYLKLCPSFCKHWIFISMNRCERSSLGILHNRSFGTWSPRPIRCIVPIKWSWEAQDQLKNSLEPCQLAKPLWSIFAPALLASLPPPIRQSYVDF